MNALPQIADHIGPLIGKLGSPHDGEVLSAARALSRQLDRRGLSFNDLADSLLTSAPEQPAQSDEPTVFTDYAEAVEWLLTNDCGELTVRDISFCKDMRGILYSWPPKPKQAAWIRSLVERLGGRFNG